MTMTDWQFALARLRRMTVLEWSHGIACMAVIVGWTLFALGRGGW